MFLYQGENVANQNGESKTEAIEEIKSRKDSVNEIVCSCNVKSCLKFSTYPPFKLNAFGTTGPWTSRKNILELIELSSINKVSLV